MYRKALDEGLYPSLRRLFEGLGVGVSLVSKSVTLTRLPDAIVTAFDGPLDTQFRWAAPLAEAVQKDPDGIMARARLLATGGQCPRVRPACSKHWLLVPHPALLRPSPPQLKSRSLERRLQRCPQTPRGGWWFALKRAPCLTPGARHWRRGLSQVLSHPLATSLGWEVGAESAAASWALAKKRFCGSSAIASHQCRAC